MLPILFLLNYSLGLFVILFLIRVKFGFPNLPFIFFIIYYVIINFSILLLSFYIIRKVWLRLMFRPPPASRQIEDVTPENYKIPFEKIRLRSEDGTEVRGWFIPAREKSLKHLGIKEPKGTVVICHGITSSRYFHLPRSIFLYYLGYNILLFDLRAHGHSGGEYVTFGYKEQYDLKAAVDYVKKRRGMKGKKIVLVGHSMGAATGILYLAKNEGVDAFISVSTYSSVEEDMKYWVTKVARLPRLPIVVYFAKKMFREALKVDFKEINPIDHIQEVKIPIFFIHGEKDDVNDYRSSEKLFALANEPKQIWIIKNAKHETLYENAGREFERRIRDFLKKYVE